MKRIFIAIVVLIMMAAVFVGGYFVGLFDGLPRHAVEEFKVCHVNLTYGSTNLSPQTREYLKERLYWNAAVYVPSGYFTGYRFDFGPIDESALGAARGIKDCSTSVEVYEHAMRKHGQKGKYPAMGRTVPPEAAASGVQ